MNVVCFRFISQLHQKSWQKFGDNHPVSKAILSFNSAYCIELRIECKRVLTAVNKFLNHSVDFFGGNMYSIICIHATNS